MKNVVIKATWDDEASVWVVTSDDIRGLALEADSLEEIPEKLNSVIADLVELNHSWDASHVPMELLAHQNLGYAASK